VIVFGDGGDNDDDDGGDDDHWRQWGYQVKYRQQARSLTARLFSPRYLEHSFVFTVDEDDRMW